MSELLRCMDYVKSQTKNYIVVNDNLERRSISVVSIVPGIPEWQNWYSDRFELWLF